LYRETLNSEPDNLGSYDIIYNTIKYEMRSIGHE